MNKEGRSKIVGGKRGDNRGNLYKMNKDYKKAKKNLSESQKLHGAKKYADKYGIKID